MFRPVSLFIGLRYTRAKRRNHFISFISLTSMLGIALGVAVLITVLSVMNGFDGVIKERLFELVPHITVQNVTGKISDWQSLIKRLQHDPEVNDVAPFVSGQGMLTHLGVVRGVLVTGIELGQSGGFAKLGTKMIAGKLSALAPGKFGIVLGRQLAMSLGLQLGDKVTLVTPEATLSPAGVLPRFKRFDVVGIFNAGNGFQFDSKLAFINLNDAQTLYQLDKGVTGIRLSINNLYQAPRLSDKIAGTLNNNFYVTNWTQQYGPLFKAISLEKTMMFLILLLIIAVAAFNLVSTLVMVVSDKRSDIAILRTLGATPRDIMGIFIVQGFVIGLIGTALGLMGGVLLSLNATAIVSTIEYFFHVQLLSSNVYYVNYLPSKIEWSDVIQISILALLLSLIATIYPAWRAARTQPAEALRYE